MKPKQNTKIQESVELKPLQKEVIKVKIVGTTPLLMNKMDMQVVENINAKKSLKTTTKDSRDERDKVQDKIHHCADGTIGIPVAGFLKGMVECAPYIDGLDKKRVMTSIRLQGEIVQLKYSKQTVHETWGRTSGQNKTPMLIVRPRFHDWSVTLEILFNKSNISPEHIINVLNWAGFQMGVGAWRPQNGGTFGQYEVAINKKA
jgi:hypothetical protein